MENIFQLTPYSVDELLPQLSRILEKRTELTSRQRLPAIWRFTDRLNSKSKASEAVLKRRRILCLVWGVAMTIMGVILFAPGLMEPETLTVPLIVGDWLCFLAASHFLSACRTIENSRELQKCCSKRR